MSEHIILVAFHVTAPTRDRAHVAVEALMPEVGETVSTAEGDDLMLEGWWVAEDDRQDRSDNDSAVFVNKGSQARSFDRLLVDGLTKACNDPRPF